MMQMGLLHGACIQAMHITCHRHAVTCTNLHAIQAQSLRAEQHRQIGSMLAICELFDMLLQCWGSTVHTASCRMHAACSCTDLQRSDAGTLC
jgi:hypothetical protein